MWVVSIIAKVVAATHHTRPPIFQRKTDLHIFCFSGGAPDLAAVLIGIQQQHVQQMQVLYTILYYTLLYYTSL